MADDPATPTDTSGLLDEIAHWTGIAGQMQQLLMEHGAGVALKMTDDTADAMAKVPTVEPADVAAATSAWWKEALSSWQSFMPLGLGEGAAALAKDRRFADARWQEPVFDMIRQSYATIAGQLLEGVEAVDGIEPRTKEQMRFATKGFVDAMSPANFMATNPEVMKRTVETKGENLLTGLRNMLADIARPDDAESRRMRSSSGRNLATTPGKVIKETKLYQLIQYAPTTMKCWRPRSSSSRHGSTASTSSI
jgi:polyhydroxyalkanoate synthase